MNNMQVLSYAVEDLAYSKDEMKVFLVMQSGGTSGEWYASMYDSNDEAIAGVHRHRRGSYDALGPFEVTLPLDEGTMLQLLQEVCRDVGWHSTGGTKLCNHYLPWTAEDYEDDEEDDGS